MRQDPPLQPHPEIGALVREHESRDEKREKATLVQFKKAISAAALREAKGKVGAAIGRVLALLDDPAALSSLKRPFSFVQQPLLGALASQGSQGSARTVKVQVQGPEVETSAAEIKEDVRLLEDARDEVLRSSAQKAQETLRRFSDFAARELESALEEQVASYSARYLRRDAKGRARSSFLQASQRKLPPQVNVDIAPSAKKYPTAFAMVEDMQQRRGLREELLRETMLKESLVFANNVNDIIQEGVRGAAARVRAQFAK
ncbi:unnamed protein product [Effrenium voratum]|nr:unnamed protein product [Effrenium voratum]CAJ1425682.1 unnamed protein product [Effrenium voratum]